MKRLCLVSIFVLAIFALVVVTCKDPSPTDEVYTVTFDKNGGDTEASPQTIKVTSPATTVVTLPTAPTREGYTFTGWNTAANGSGTAFTATTVVTKSITVYAQWLEVPEGSFVVTFDKNGGDTEADPQSKVVTPPATTIDELPTVPTWDGYTFTGWNTEADGSGTAFTAATEVTENITVYAQWQEVPEGSFTVTFDKNGGDTEADPQSKVVIPPATTIDELPTAPTRDGYTFEGWNTEANGSGDAFTAATEVTEDITVYAQWLVVPPGSFVVTFDKNGGDTEADPLSKVVTPPATTIDALPTAPTRDGYTFNGWNTEANGSGTAFTAATTVTATITVYAQWTLVAVETTYTIELDITGNGEGDSVTVSPESGKAGDTITINYTLAGGYLNNRLVFSDVEASIEEVDEAGTGTRTYTIAAADADLDDTITIIATFTHTNKQIDTIAFAATTQNKVYGDAAFTVAVSSAGSGSGAITYSSAHPDIATVNASTGQVTIVKVGETTITATKAADATYEGTTANYALHIAPRQLIIGEPGGSKTKPYDKTTTAHGITAGSLTNKVGADDVTVSVTSATYNSADVASATTITVVYSISGTKAENYIKPVNSTITGATITKAQGAAVTAPSATGATITHSHITIVAVESPSLSGQAVEYGIGTSNTTAPTTWQDGLAFSGLDEETDYYVFARSKSDGNYNAGPPVASAKITTLKGLEDGATLTGTVTVYLLRHNSVRISSTIAEPANGQTVEYAVSTASTAPTSGWQDGRDFTGLTANTAYYAYARAKANEDYSAGTAISIATFTTKAAPTPAYGGTPPVVVNFESDTVGQTYSATQNNTPHADVAVVADPDNEGEKSLQIITHNYNQAIIVPITLAYALQDYESFTFRLNHVSGLSNQSISLYAADVATKFKQFSFGNPSTDTNNFAELLVGTVLPDYQKTNQWVDYEITINAAALNNAIKNLTGDIYLALGTNQNGHTVMFDDLTFNMKPYRNSTITPTTATYYKSPGNDILVTVDFKGNTLAIKNEGTTLTQGEHYTVADGVVTLLSSYFSPLAVGEITLTFDFSEGEDSEIVITIMAAVPTVVTSYNFSTDPNISTPNDVNDVGKVRFSPTFPTSGTITSGITWVQPTTPNGTDGYLNVANGQNYSSGNMLIIPFNLGTDNMGKFKTIRLYLEGVSGDTGYGKQLSASVLRPNQTTFSTNGGGNNYQLVNNQSVRVDNATAGTEIKITLPTPTTYDLSYLTGLVEIAFYFNTNAIEYRIHSIALSEAE
jgi:uncharacterized repeat protein (TIGR02543 family)